MKNELTELSTDTLNAKMNWWKCSERGILNSIHNLWHHHFLL